MKHLLLSCFVVLLFNGTIFSQTILINEVDVDQKVPVDGANYDATEFVELYDGGAGNTSLDGFILVQYSGDGAVVEWIFDLDGYSTDENGFFVVGDAVYVPNLGIELNNAPTSSIMPNSSNAVALYQLANVSDLPEVGVENTEVPLDGLADALYYHTSDDARDIYLPLLNSGQDRVDEHGLGNKNYHSNQRYPDGAGGARNTSEYVQAYPTPGAPNRNVNTGTICSLAIDVTDGTNPLDGVEVTVGDYTSISVDGKAHFPYFLLEGDYAYTIVKDGYQTVSDNVILPTSNDIVEVTLDVEDVSTGISEVMQDKAISVYPNPTVGDLNIELPSDVSGCCSVVIYDITGSRIKEMNTRKKKINISDLPKGKYLINIVSDGFQGATTVVRQ